MSLGPHVGIGRRRPMGGISLPALVVDTEISLAWSSAGGGTVTITPPVTTPAFTGITYTATVDGVAVTVTGTTFPVAQGAVPKGVQVTASMSRSGHSGATSSASTTVGAETVPPTITITSYNGSDLGITTSEPVTYYYTWSASSTPMTAAAIQAAAGSPAFLTTGASSIPLSDTLLTPGTWFLHSFGRDAAGNQTVLTALSYTKSGATGLKAQVEALDQPGATGARIALTVINPGSLPAGMALSGSKIVINQPGIYTGWDFRPYRVEVAAPDVTVQDFYIADDGTFGPAGYLFDPQPGATNCLLQYGTLEGSGLPRRTDNQTQVGPGALGVSGGADLRIHRVRYMDFPADGQKVNADRVLVDECYFFGAKSVPDYPIYNPAQTYAAGVWVRFMGTTNFRPYLSKQAVPINTPPSGTSSDTVYWDAPGPHTDYITILSGSGSKVRNCLFESTAGEFLGATQYIRVVRNTGADEYIGETQIVGNVFRPWPGAYPLAVGYTREVEAQTSWSVGEITYQSGRFFRALAAASGAAQRPDVDPARWQEIADTQAGEVVFAHNWIADGTSAPFDSLSVYGGHVVFGPNFFEDDDTTVPPLNGSVVRDTLPEPAFGADLAYTHPEPAFTGARARITPSAYGKYRVAGVTIDACVIRVAGRVVCYFTPGANLVVPADVPYQITAIPGGATVELLALTGGAEMPAPFYVAAGAATIVDMASEPTLFSFNIYNEANAAPTAIPGLRVRINGGAWQAPAAAGLSLVGFNTSTREIEFSGLPGGTTSLEVHYEQQQPGEPYSASNSIDGIYIRGAIAPANPSLPGVALAPTLDAAPIIATIG